MPKSNPLKAVVMAPIGDGGEPVPLLELCDGIVTYLVPDEVRIAYAQGLLDRAAEMLSEL